jgi:MoaA/NifB/PqqE/SkfB family radical SAM enzyme
MELPSYVQIEPVGQCNLKCTMCPIQYRRDGPPYGPPAFMDFDRFTDLVNRFITLEELHLQGLGEPMMHPRFFDMIEYAARRGVKVTTNTNFTLLTPRRAERLVRSGLDSLHVSIDGATAATYEAIRPPGKFDRLLRNLRLFNDTRRRIGSPRPRLQVVTVVMRRNLHELPAIVRLAAESGAGEHFVQHLCHEYGEMQLPDQYRAMRDFVAVETLAAQPPHEVGAVFDEARREAARLGIDLRLPNTTPRHHPAGTPGRARCSWPWTGAYVSYDGLAMPCCMISTPDRFNFGSMAERGVEAVWNGEGYRKFRERLDSGDPPDICRTCGVYNGTF